MNKSSHITIESSTSATAEVTALIEELDRELAQHYCCDQRHGLSLDAIFQPHIRFFIARVDGVAVGCGGVALFDGFAELKRMYVRPAYRGRRWGRGTGVAEAIINKLFETARDAGRNIVRLETGTKQLAAMRFYEKFGFHTCSAFEPYASMPPHTIAESVFMERTIPPSRAGRGRGGGSNVTGDHPCELEMRF